MAYTVASTTTTPEQMAADFKQTLEPSDPAQTPHSSVSFVSTSGFDDDAADAPADAAKAADAKKTTPKPGPSDPAASDDDSDDAPKAPVTPAAEEPAADQAELAAKEGYTDEEWKALGEKTRKRIAKLVKERNIARDERNRSLQSRPTTPAPTPDPAAGAPNTGPQTPAPDEQPPAAEETPVNKWVPEGFRPRPTLEDHDFDAEAHDDALDEWRAELREARRVETQRRADAKVAAEQAVTAAKAVQARFAEAVEDAKTRIQDWDTATSAVVPDFKHPQQVRDFDAFIANVSDTEGNPLGPDVLYHLATHPDALARVTSAPGPTQMAMALGAVAYAVEQARTPAEPAKAEPPVPQKPRTQAPAPLQRVAGVSVADSEELDDPNLSQAEWERRREARMRRSKG